MQVYYHSESPYAQRVLYLLDILQIDSERIQVDLAKRENRREFYVEINVFGRVPAIVDNGFHLSESLAILRYLVARESIRDGAVAKWYPEGLQERASVDQWVEYVSHHACRPFLDLAWARTLAPRYGFAVQPGIEASAMKKLERELPILEDRLATDRYLCGSTPTLADVALFPFVNLAEPANLDLAAAAPRLQSWRIKMAEARTSP